MTKSTRARYTLEFKEEAVRLVTGGERMATVAIRRLIPLSQVHRLLTDRPHLRCAHRPDEIRWLSCDGVAVA